jgi:hypothetical protein
MKKGRGKDFGIRFERGFRYVAEGGHVFPKNDRDVEDVRYGAKAEGDMND